MIKFYSIRLVNTVKGVKFGYIPMSATCYLLPKRARLFSRDNLFYTVDESCGIDNSFSTIKTSFKEELWMLHKYLL